MLTEVRQHELWKTNHTGPRAAKEAIFFQKIKMKNLADAVTVH